MTLRFSHAGPAFPEPLVDALLNGDVVFLCGAGVSAPQLPGFDSLVTRCFLKLDVDMSPSEDSSFNSQRFEEALGSLSRRIVNPGDMIRAIVDELRTPTNVDLSNHRTILRLSRDLENRPVIITTNFDTLIERALLEVDTKDQVRDLSFAGQDLPPPGSTKFSGIIHIHGRIADDDLGLNETPLIVTSADYGDAYMRSGWISRFLFDLCRCKTIVLVGYRAGDAPVRYFLNVIEADRQRFPDLRPVYALGPVEARDQGDVHWAALGVEAIAYEYLPDSNGEMKCHAALWNDLSKLASLVERPRAVRREWARQILARPFAEASAAELDFTAWLFRGRRDLWPIAITTIVDGDWFDFFADQKLWADRDAAWILAAWMIRDLQSPDRFRRAIEWLEKLGKAFADEIARSLLRVQEVPPLWIRFWRLLTHSRPEREGHPEDSAYALMKALEGPVVLQTDLERAVSILTPILEIRSSPAFFEGEHGEDSPRRLSDLAWPRLALSDRSGTSGLIGALAASRQPLAVMEIASARLWATIGLSIDVGIVDDDYDANDGAVPSVEPHVQNEHYDGPILLVELLARLIAPATIADRGAVRAHAAIWKAMPGLLGKRLWLYALRQPDLFTADEAISGVAELSRDAFWSVRRELALVLRDRVGDASAELVAVVEHRILNEGPAYYARYKIGEGQADWRCHALDAGIWLRLNMLEQAGSLSAKGAAALEAIKARREYLRRDVEEQDFFGSYMTGVHSVVGDAQPIIDAAEGERLQVVREVLDSHDMEKQQGWSVFCRTDPTGAFNTLRAAPLDEANAPLWRDLIGALSFVGGETDPTRRLLIVSVFATLEPAGAPFLAQIVDRLVDLYWSSPRQSEPAIANWWPRLFASAVISDTKQLDPTRDLYADLINTAGGKLTQALLIDVEGRRKSHEPIDRAMLAALETAAGAQGRQGAMARGALVFTAGFVLTIEGQQVTPLLDAALAGDGDEGVSLRRVLVTNPSLSPVASRTFSAHVLRGLNELTDRGHGLTNAAAKIIGPALSIIRSEQTEADWGMSVVEVARALRTGPAALRNGAAKLLTQWIQQIADDRAVAWRTGIGPLMRASWPRERIYCERRLSQHFADLAVGSGDAFPEALEQLLPHISLLEGQGDTHSIENSEAPEKFARETLVLLWKLFGPGTTSELYGIPKILNRLIASMPAIELDRRLQWLDQKATRYE
ncbi:SIR2 family protein [Gluconacetobacter azotocaptans]|uniref:SIR2 family protein n=1 Tax=Gluconacetobacter azotocaptans TaxID=142834 RepID=UPI00195CA86B|nr:SIR2 family protein [Gluconacetobacter azotocaptans]MBM9400784.1 SIR2 family protein [Gluconacetobacter azotocaptans]